MMHVMGRSRGSLTTVSGLGVFLSLCWIAYCYWDNPKQLLRYGFSSFLVIALLVVARHVWFSLAGPLKASFGNRKKENGEVHRRPDLDRGKEEARKKAQKVHKEKAEDFEQRVTAPRREQKLQQLEEKLKSIRGFQGEGSVVGSCSEGTNDRSSRLMGEHDEVIRRRKMEERRGAASDVTGINQSDSESEEENKEGRLITIALKLPSKSVHKQFRTSHRIKSLYRWLQSLGYSPKFYCLATTLPRCLLSDPQQTLEQCGLSRDTALALEEKES